MGTTCRREKTGRIVLKGERTAQSVLILFQASLPDPDGAGGGKIAR